jgi:hypothetical protein
MVGIKARLETTKPLTSARKVASARCCRGAAIAGLPKVRCGPIEMATKSKPTKAPPVPALARKNSLNPSGAIVRALSNNDGNWSTSAG